MEMSVLDYKVGDYQTMSLSEKIDFLCRVHRDEISLWDEDGNDNEIWLDYHNVEGELLDHPEILDCEDLLHIMKIFDDDCFEITWQFNLAKIVCGNCRHYGKSRVAFYLQHLEEIPPNGRFHGWHFPIQWLMGEEDFPMLKEAVQEQTVETQKRILEILEGVEGYPEEREELKAVIN